MLELSFMCGASVLCACVPVHMWYVQSGHFHACQLFSEWFAAIYSDVAVSYVFLVPCWLSLCRLCSTRPAC